ncbi:MAG: hypothetical protein KGS72_05635, partial [Cyanobacteria bacterium REEB67]|nr:hypothetical protein [Cyanobacteria bacterium REEB67]
DLTNSQAPLQEHAQSVSVEGLEHLFKWASDVVSEGEDERVRQAREKRVRRQVLEVVQQYREQKVVAKNQDEVAYLQRRVIALLQKLQEMTEENAAVKQIMVSQYWAIQRIPFLEEQVKALKVVEYEKESAIKERRYLMDALAKVKVERDYLEDILNTCEDENTRLANILKATRSEMEELKARRWWHMFWPAKKQA